MNDPLKVGDMVLIIYTHPDKIRFLGLPTTIIRQSVMHPGDWILEARYENGNYLRASPTSLLKITPPPTMIETEKEMTV
jgi:hypothetical protein